MFQSERIYADMLKPTTSSIGGSNQHQASHLDAVIIRNLIYEVGGGSSKKRILNQINLTVPEGSIYGLLGPSGCGKTTMLRCVVGRLKSHSGSVLVFGVRPDDGSSEVPGRDVGYMPQEISIYEDFTIEETLRFFGKINRMQDKAIGKRIEFLLQFLDLPSKKRLVSNLSGGQKRRVSLAAALVHSPPLLILDEPTVGVDPLLRQSIWKHLVSLTQTEKISVIITTHYIEEARQANVVGLMRHGKILAEDAPDQLMQLHQLNNLEDVFLKLCVTDSSRHAATLANARQVPTTSRVHYPATSTKFLQFENDLTRSQFSARTHNNATNVVIKSSALGQESTGKTRHRSSVMINTGNNEIELNKVADLQQQGGYINEVAENFSSEEDDDHEPRGLKVSPVQTVGHRELAVQVSDGKDISSLDPSNYRHSIGRDELRLGKNNHLKANFEDYLTHQAIKWATRRANELSFLKLNMNRSMGHSVQNRSSLVQWWLTLMAVTWKNYTRLRRNPPVLIFQFMLPAIQVILFCLCIGGEPFDVPVAIVNDEVVPRSSLQFLNGLNKKIIRQIKYDNLTSAKEAVRKGHVWGAIHIPDKYSQNLQSRLIMGEDVTNETISNGTIRVYPDLTNLHLALALETTFRETFVNFAKDSLDEMGYDRSLADLPIQIGQPIYGTLKKDSYLEFMAPGVVISICYVMATGLTALAFILERRDGLLERSLVSGVQTSQILLAHAINQVVVMIIQIFMVLGCIFFVFEIPSRGPFFWVVLLILLQGCTGMGFGLLVSAICKEENTAVMMVVGTFYTNLILAGIIWPIEAMPHWLRPLSYAQPQTLPTDTLRHILSRGWGITESGVMLGFAVTIGWLFIFLVAAGVIFKYSR